MGYAFIVSVKIYDEQGAYARLQDLLRRTRKPDGPYDATLLLVADWDASTQTLVIKDSGGPADDCAAPFFGDLLNAVITNTPVGIHQAVREGRDGKAPVGGAPNPIADAADAAKAKQKAADQPEDEDDGPTRATRNRTPTSSAWTEGVTAWPRSTSAAFSQPCWLVRPHHGDAPSRGGPPWSKARQRRRRGRRPCQLRRGRHPQ